MATLNPVVLNLLVEHFLSGGRVFWHWFSTMAFVETFATLFTELWLAAILSASLFSSATLVFLTSQLFERNFAGISAATTFLDPLACVSALNLKIVTPVLLST